MADELIVGATSPTYVSTALDVGRMVYCRVTASNVVGSAFADAVPVGPIEAGLAPVNTVAPVASCDPTPEVGDPATSTTGTWTGTAPITFAYQWYHYLGLVAIPGATLSTYVFQTSDIGLHILCQVTASNFYGSETAWTNVLGPALAAGDPPVIFIAPELSVDGPDTVIDMGDTLTCPEGDWTGTEPITYAYQWCQAVVDETGEVVTDENGDPVGVAIEGATEATYVVGGAAAAAPFAFINSVTSIGSATFSTGAMDTTGAKLLVVGISYYAGALADPPVITDNKGNTWTPLTLQAGSLAASRIWYSTPTTVGVGHTVAATSTINFYGTVTFMAFSGGAASTYEGHENGATGSSTTASASTGITPTPADCLIIANVSGGADTFGPTAISPAAPAAGGFTIRGATNTGGGSNIGGAVAYLIQTTAAAADPDWTISGASGEWAASIASFKSA